MDQHIITFKSNLKSITWYTLYVKVELLFSDTLSYSKPNPSINIRLWGYFKIMLLFTHSTNKSLHYTKIKVLIFITKLNMLLIQHKYKC